MSYVFEQYALVIDSESSRFDDEEGEREEKNVCLLIDRSYSTKLKQNDRSLGITSVYARNRYIPPVNHCCIHSEN